MLGDKEEKVTEYAWITSLKITKGNAKKIVRAGRNRWKIENQGFNRQKHWQGNIEHACSFQEQAQKNHYLMERIADFIKQLYEYFYLKKNEIKKLQNFSKMAGTKVNLPFDADKIIVDLSEAVC